jgi:2-methylcitrate dehydratase PrpD
VGQLFGATAAAASAAALTPDKVAVALSYSVQQCSGVTTLFRDPEHVEKAFAMGGMQAHNAVRSVEFVRSGFSGVADVLDNSPSFFDSYTYGGDRSKLMQELAGKSHLLTTDMKQYPVGMPIQPAAEAMEALVAEHGLRPDEVARIVCRLPSEKSRIVDNRPMPDVNVQYILSVILSDGRLTFASSHDYDRLQTPAIREIMGRVELIHDTGLDPDPTVKGFTRRGVIEVTTVDGRHLVHRVDAALGSRKNPMKWDHVVRKAHAVLDDDFPADLVDGMLAWADGLDSADSIRSIGQFLSHPGCGGKGGH